MDAVLETGLADMRKELQKSPPRFAAVAYHFSLHLGGPASGSRGSEGLHPALLGGSWVVIVIIGVISRVAIVFPHQETRLFLHLKLPMKLQVDPVPNEGD